MHDNTSEAILVWGGSSPLLFGARLWLKQDSRTHTKSFACVSIDPVSLELKQSNKMLSKIIHHGRK